MTQANVNPPADPPAPSASGWRQARQSLRLIGVALVVGVLITVVYRVLRADLYTQLRDTENLDTRLDLYKSFRLYAQIFPTIGIACSVAIALGVFNLTRAFVGSAVRYLGLFACLAIAVEVVHNSLWLAQTLSDEPQSFTEFLMKPWVMGAMAVVSGLSFVCLLVIFARLSRALGRPIPQALIAAAVGAIAWESGFPLYTVIFDVQMDMPFESPWSYLVLTSSLWVAGQVVYIYLVRRLSRVLVEHPPASLVALFLARPGGAQLSTAWGPAASGLELYAAGLSWRVFGTLATYVVLLLGVFGRSQPMLKLATGAAPVIALITALVMVVGIVRYARQPDEGDAAGTAWVAAVIMGIGVLLEAYGFTLVLRQLSLDATSWSAYSEMREIAEQAQTLSMWAMGLAFVGLLSLMFSFGQLTAHIKRPDLSSRVISIGLFMGVVAIAVLAFRSHAVHAKGDPGGLIVMGIMIALTALIAVFAYLNLVNNIAEALRPYDDNPDLPTARVVS